MAIQGSGWGKGFPQPHIDIFLYKN